MASIRHRPSGTISKRSISISYTDRGSISGMSRWPGRRTINRFYSKLHVIMLHYLVKFTWQIARINGLNVFFLLEERCNNNGFIWVNMNAFTEIFRIYVTKAKDYSSKNQLKRIDLLIETRRKRFMMIFLNFFKKFCIFFY